MILEACVRNLSTVSSPSKNSYVSTYPIRSCSYGSSSQLWCFKPVSINFPVLQYLFWRGTLGLPAIFMKMLQQEFMHWQNDFFCSVSHPTNSGILATFLTTPDCWAGEDFGELRSFPSRVCDTNSQSLSRGWCCCALICSTWHFLPLNSLCCCTLPGYLGGCPTPLLLQQQRCSREIPGYFELCARIFVVFIALLSRQVWPHRPQPMSLWGSTGHLLLRWDHPFSLSLFPISKQIIYLHKATCFWLRHWLRAHSMIVFSSPSDLKLAFSWKTGKD